MRKHLKRIADLLRKQELLYYYKHRKENTND